MDKTSLGDRMKNFYENRNKTFLTRRTPVIVRLDGKAFHSFTKGFERPFSKLLKNMMVETAIELCRQIDGAKMAYTQSDEISILITDFNKLNTQAWFDYLVQKIASVSASIATAIFNKEYILYLISQDKENGVVMDLEKYKCAYFDARVFNIPEDEVANYFIWRQKDWERNSLQMLAQDNFSHSELQGKGRDDMHEMLHTKNINWAKLDNVRKRGTTILYNEATGWYESFPVFIENRNICKCVMAREE